MAIRHGGKKNEKKKRKETQHVILHAHVLLTLLRSVLMQFHVEQRVNMNIYSNMEMRLRVSLSTLDMRPLLALN